MILKVLGFIVAVIIIWFAIIIAIGGIGALGTLMTGNITYSDFNEPIRKMYVVQCHLDVGKRFNLFTRTISHHGILCIMGSNAYIVSRIRNTVQVMEVASIDDYTCTDIDGYTYGIIYAFEIDGLTLQQLTKYGEEICSKHKYVIFGHNCQEFVYEILQHYGVLSEKDISPYRGWAPLILQGVSEVLNGL